MKYKKKLKINILRNYIYDTNIIKVNQQPYNQERQQLRFLYFIIPHHLDKYIITTYIV